MGISRLVRYLSALSALAIVQSCANDDASQPLDTETDAGTDADGGDPSGDDAFWNSPPQIYCGDLHAHSTHSMDVFVMQTPLLDGPGVVGVEVLCDFGHYCSQLDFWSLTDHQTEAPTESWAENIDSATLCDARRETHADAPIVYMGYEWQQSSLELAQNYGHKNVIFQDLTGLPARPLTAAAQVTSFTEDDISLVATLASQADPENASTYGELRDYIVSGLRVPECDPAESSTTLPEDCIESVEDPATLFRKLREWETEVMVIPHGTCWGQHHVPLFGFDPQLDPEQRDPELQPLIEIYSGHGSLEEYRTWRAATLGSDGALTCPEPSTEYLPCCWQAGEITRELDPTCIDAPNSESCGEVVTAARQAYLDAGRDGILTIPDAEPEDWLDCGECRDCFQPAQQYRPRGSAQAAMTTTYFDDNGQMLNWHWGFVAATDSHAVGPGAGYKEFREMSDIFGPARPEFDAIVDVAAPQVFPEWERQNSYYYSGGITGVHAPERTRESVFQSMQSRRTIATSGDRIELWFDIENGPDGPLPLGSDVSLDEAPEFVARARGAFIQAPGCDDATLDAAPDGFVEEWCFGECYNPTQERHSIDRIELVRVLPQLTADEDPADLITDPLAIIECDGNPRGCTARFTDPEWTQLGRPALYYVRALQEPTEQLNADNYRCVWDEDGSCIGVSLCEGGHRGSDDECMGLDQERAWASPIRVAPE